VVADVEAVEEADGGGGFQIGGDVLGVDFGLGFVGEGEDDEVGGGGGLGERVDGESGGFGPSGVFSVCGMADDGFYAGVAEVLGMGGSLISIAEHGDGAVAKGIEGGLIITLEDGEGHGRIRQQRAGNGENRSRGGMVL